MRIKLFSLLIFIFLLPSCEKEESRHTLPYARVYFRIDINGIDSDLTHFSHKTFSKGRTIGETVGYAGLLAFRDGNGYIYVYDLACPYEKDRYVKIVPDDAGKAVCPQCGSEYVIMYGTSERNGTLGLGTPVKGKGPATQPLQSYLVTGTQRQGEFLVIN